MKNEMRLRAESRVNWKFKKNKCSYFDRAECEDIDYFHKVKKHLDIIEDYMTDDNRLDEEMFGSIHYAIGIVKDYLDNSIKECEEDIEKFDHEYYEVEGGYND